MKTKLILLCLALWAVGAQAASTQTLSPLPCFPGFPNLPGCSNPGAPDGGSGSPEGQGAWTQGTFKNSYGQRDYYLYVPKQKVNSPLPLLVFLHGCAQTAPDLAKASHMNAVADEHGFAILYPQQSSSANSTSCWNWFDPANFTRGGGELGIIVGMVGEVQKKVSIDSSRIVAAGFSAGAALVSNLVACHSDLFSGAAIHSGLDYKAASSMNDAWLAMSQGGKTDVKKTGTDAAHCTGAGAHMAKLLVIHGKSDYTVNSVNAERIVAQFTQVNDLLDDGQANGSQNTTVLKSESGKTPSGRSFDVVSYGGKGEIHMQKILVDGMSHAWSGGTSGMQYTDPQGPNASEMIWEALIAK